MSSFKARKHYRMFDLDSWVVHGNYVVCLCNNGRVIAVIDVMTLRPTRYYLC